MWNSLKVLAGTKTPEYCVWSIWTEWYQPGSTQSCTVSDYWCRWSDAALMEGLSFMTLAEYVFMAGK